MELPIKKTEAVNTVYVTFTDRLTKRSKGLTVYKTTPEELRQKFRNWVESQQKTPHKRQTA